MPSTRPRWLKVGLTVIVVAAATALAALTALALAGHAREELVEDKRVAAEMIVKVFASSLVAPLDFGDDEGVQRKLDELRTNEQIESAGVWRPDEDVAVAEFGPRLASAPEGREQIRVTNETLEFVAPVIDPTARHVGTVTVTFTLRPELERFASTRRRMLLGAVLIALLFCAALPFVGRRQGVTRHGVSVSRDAAQRPDASGGLPSGFSRPDGLARGPRPGEVLGQHQLLACVGEGGMGRVWAARRVGSSMSRLVAVKTAINPDTHTPELRHLFMDEARIALLIRHPNVCGVNELGEHQGALYQVMEWCDGASLRQVLDRLPGARMELPLAARIIAKVSAGLHAAHELEDDDGVRMHVVHRDVSPQNILLASNGQVKVTDFGVAKAHGQLHRPTETGEVKGKLTYMAPEQVTASTIDRRADIFSLGCVLYEVTVGCPPFGGDGALSTLYQLMSQPAVSPCERVSDYPEDLANIVLKALAKEPADRYQTAEELSAALESWLWAQSRIVTEQTIAEMLERTCGDLIAEKARRIAQAIELLAPVPVLEPADHDLAGPPSSTPRPTRAVFPSAAPPVDSAPALSAPPATTAIERATLPARPIRKQDVTQ